eukprot:TRINITY_DN73195_c0_g1_i1.p1 TRINITY_DN73195_c0_g1~~TRINITY_DN73195_c0_g1_i1.p1  ORF type:complete len:179 (-),score=21.61 TRINITY_DN73195_c0_g1_i1:290-760(-)
MRLAPNQSYQSGRPTFLPLLLIALIAMLLVETCELGASFQNTTCFVEGKHASCHAARGTSRSHKDRGLVAVASGGGYGEDQLMNWPHPEHGPLKVLKDGSSRPWGLIAMTFILAVVLPTYGNTRQAMVSEGLCGDTSTVDSPCAPAKVFKRAIIGH